MAPNIRPNRIKEWIVKRSLNQSEVARQLGISTSYLSLITNGKRNPNLRLSTKLANLLDANLLDLFPQLDETDVPAESLDMVACLGPRPEFDELTRHLKEAGVSLVPARGDFETGYFVAHHRPRMLIIDVENIGRTLNALVQRVRGEPTTGHVRIIPLVGPETGKRRRRQIEKMGLDIHEWTPTNLAEVAASLAAKLNKNRTTA